MMIQFFYSGVDSVFPSVVFCYRRVDELPCGWPEGCAFQVNFIQLLDGVGCCCCFFAYWNFSSWLIL